MFALHKYLGSYPRHDAHPTKSSALQAENLSIGLLKQ